MQITFIKALTLALFLGNDNAKELPPTDGRYFYADLSSGTTYGMHYLNTIVGEH